MESPTPEKTHTSIACHLGKCRQREEMAEQGGRMGFIRVSGYHYTFCIEFGVIDFGMDATFCMDFGQSMRGTEVFVS